MLKKYSIFLGFIFVILTINFLIAITLAETTDHPKPSPQTKPTLLEEAPKAVFAHIMVQFRSKQYSGDWGGWNRLDEFMSRIFPDWHMFQHNPENIYENGRADIPSVYYPSIGLYDMMDPNTVEYQCQLAKIAGIDGFIFDLPLFDESGPKWEQWKPACMRLYVRMMKRYNLKAVICYEDSYNLEQSGPEKNRSDVIMATYADMNAWLDLFKDVQYCIGKRPLLLFFSYESLFKGKGGGIAKLLPQEIDAWTKQFSEETRPVIANQWLRRNYAGTVEGEYDWIYLEPAKRERTPLIRYADIEAVMKRRKEKSTQMREWLKHGYVKFPISGVWPEFNDRPVWGWGSGPSLMPGMDGKIYRYLWEEAIKEGYPVVQIATWNDWFEGSIIEPSVENGTKYLEITREFTAKFKKMLPSEASFQIPEKIYKIRKSTKEKGVLHEMEKACDLIRIGQYIEAENIVKPCAKKLNVETVKYWN